MVNFFRSDNETVSSSSVSLSIWPTYHDYTLKEFVFDVYSNYLNGDINNDGSINVLDVVSLVSIILDENNSSNMGDINTDGSINVLDIVMLVGLILG